VLDVSRGRPAAGVPVTLEVEAAGGWHLVGKGITNADGRISDLVPADSPIAGGVYRLIFDTGKYFANSDIQGFYPQVTVVFKIENSTQHYHVPLLLSPFGYSTYRGS
jgi:5-hydroxyisourate hydrolase